MTNEELVSLIQAGDRDLIPQLWEQVGRFVALQADRYARAVDGYGGITSEDLYQCGYIALVSAIETFDADKECKFITWYAYYLKTAFVQASGRRTSKRDPLNICASLDKPIDNGEDSDTTLGDFQADSHAEQDFDDAENRIWLDQLHTALDAALNDLPDKQSEAIRRQYYQGETLGEIALSNGVSRECVRQCAEKGFATIRSGRYSQGLKQFIEFRTPYYHSVGVRQFQSTNTSAVEQAVFARERLLEYWRNKHSQVSASL